MTLDNDAIIALINGYDKESKALKNEALKFCWYMRGGLTYTEAMNLSKEEREIIAKIIEDNLEATKKSGLPFF